jgi:hypothetical protein
MSRQTQCVGDLDDNIVTTFCDVVTSAHKPKTVRAHGFVINVVGEAMAPASDLQSFGWRQPGAGAALTILILFAACGGDGHRAAPPLATPVASPSVANPAVGVTTQLDGTAPELGVAIIAELVGDDAAARTAFQTVLDAPDVPAPIAARSALHLAQLEARAGKRRPALDLVARAAALAPGDPAITDGVARVQADVVAASSAGDLRGPKAGTALPTVDPKTADAFAQAERALVRVHAIHPHERLEVWAKEDATEDLVARYRAIADAGGLALVAAEYRIGSLYHDLALGLLFERQGELRGPAIAYLKSAAAAYKASLAAPPLADAELWRLAAETDLRTAQDVLAAASLGE